MGTCQSVQCCTPDEVNSDTEEKQCCSKCFIKCCSLKWKIKPVEEKSKILIPHNNDDTARHDNFGANLCTFKESRTDGSVCYIHYMEDVDTGEPAGQMKINNEDEFVFVNEDFVQDMTHQEVMDRFRNVKVDGTTQLNLVLRRKNIWVKSNAVLVPDGSDDGHPVAKHLKYNKSKTSEESKTKHRYKVPGEQHFLDISNGIVSLAKINNCEETTIFWRRERYLQDNGNKMPIIFEVALSDETMRWYIGIEEEKVVLKENEPYWFRMTQTGEKCLGYEKRTFNQMKLKALPKHKPGETSNCEFEQTPLDCSFPRERGDDFASTHNG
ncbi:uncharacterized protein LOC123554437 isoform X2 [Mercenaria mercenaria]|uniref:uncharacterized protein LOC123554437 isoform X2 n=1 Tax=Mercenaria mercenaria TaxID=6596 RepID=UPI00234E4EB6|nr:uncharacterized protein LOC123554437 isoform X2 [Mercenaria mercenaria]